MLFEDQRVFIEGMDMDSDERTIMQGYYRHANNIRTSTSDTDTVNSVEGTRSNALRNTLRLPNNTEIPYPFPLGTCRVIGSVEDIKNQTLIYFLWNINGNHRIIRYFLTEKVLRDVIPPNWGNISLLNFQRSRKIWNAKVIYGGDQDYLVWTDGFNPIRKIRLDIATAYEGFTPFPVNQLSPQLINFAKEPPQQKPTLSLVSSSTNTLLLGKCFQFATRYIYDDNSISTLSPFSNIQFVEDLNTAIRVTASSGHFTVKEIQFLAREGNGVSSEGSTNPTWYVVGKVKRNTIAIPNPIIFDFTNTEPKTPVSRIDSDKLFESIPEIAGCMEVTETNQVIVGDITEGKENPTINTSLSQQVNTSPLGVPAPDLEFGTGEKPVVGGLNEVVPIGVSDFPTANNWAVPDQTSGSDGLYYNPPNDNSIFARVKFQASVWTGFVPQSPEVRILLFQNGVVIGQQTQFIPPNTTFFPGVLFTIQANPVYIKKGDRIHIGVARVGGTNPPFGFTVDFGALEILNISTYLPRPCFAPLSTATIGIQYYDNELRSGGVIEAGSVKISTPPVPFNTISTVNTFAPFVRVSINNRPPEWATHYSILVKKPPIEYGFFRVTQRETVGVNPIGARIKIDFENTYFTPQKGDRLVVYGIAFSPNELQPAFSTPEYFVDSFDLTTKEIIVNGLPIVGNYDIVMVYRISTDAPIYFEQVFLPVLNPGTSTRRHSGTVQAQNTLATLPAISDVFGPDYHVFQSDQLVYRRNYRLSFESDYWDRGRPSIVLENPRRLNIPNGIRWGGKLFPNTLVNNIAVFDSGNFTTVNQEFGAIRGMRLRGFTLKIYQEGNTNSAYLNRRTVTNADGSEQIVVTDSLIGTINPAARRYGTKHPGSIIQVYNNIYFFDEINGIFVRDSVNDLFPISDYRAVKYFRDLSEDCRSTPFHDVICGYDQKTRQLFVSFVEHTIGITQSKSKTISFEEKGEGGAWKSFHDHFIPVFTNRILPIDMYGKMGQNMFMMIDGRLWESNEGVGYLNLFGVQRQMSLKAITNAEPVKVKTFQTHRVNANRNADITILKVLPSTMYPLGMESELRPANYAYREGVYYADIKRDAFTKGAPPNIEARRLQIASGRPLRGHSMSFEMFWSGSEKIILYSSAIGILPSEKS